MEKNELSRNPDSDVVVSPDNPDDPNDPVVTTDDPNDPATNDARRRNIEMEKIGPSRSLPDPVESPDDPNDPVVTTDDPNTCPLLTITLKEIRSTCAFVTDTLKEIRAEQEKVNNISSMRSTYIGRSSIPDTNDPVVTTDDSSPRSRLVPGPCCVTLPHYSDSLYERWNARVYQFNRRNNTGSEISSEVEIEIKQLEEFLGVSLKNIDEPESQYCIHKAPNYLREINKGAYTPKVISIGPIYRYSNKYDEMEEQKLRYLLEFHKRVGAVKLEEFKSYIQANEKDISNHYQRGSSLGGHSFIKMILCDAVFIIEFFLKNVNKERGEFDFFLDTYVKDAITRDLQLLGNQLPYFHLKNLFEIGAFHNFTKEDYPDRDPFLILCHRFFFNSENDVFPEPNDQIQHFTDLRRYFLLMDFLPRGQHVRDSPTKTKLDHVRDLPTATKLHGSGVKFKKGIEGGSSLKISCEYVPRAMRIPGLKGCEIRIPFIKELRLQIPRFEIDDNSECLYRNMMALELCHYPSDTHICNFIVLMDFLINTEKDVDLFVEEGIIFSLLGDNAAVAGMFNNLGLQITPSHSVYHDISEKLKAHYARPWNRTMATLNTVYFGDIWKGTATVAAVILLVLTFIQAVSSILSLL